MAAAKGIIPIHVKMKEFVHPMREHPFIQILEKVEDPRKPSFFFRYSLISLLFMVIVSFMCGAKDWAQIVVMSQGMAEWLSKYVDMSDGVPCERTFQNIFNAIKPEVMERVLQDIACLIRNKIKREVINFDGQTMRGSADKYKDLKGIHLLNAWSVDNRICLGQLKVDDKSNEITSMPRLMDSLDLKDTVITADALNTQKEITAKAIENGADYLLPVKGNQPKLLEEITSSFKQLDIEQKQAKEKWEWAISKAKEQRDHKRLKQLLEEGVSLCGADYWESVEKNHSRVETRSCTVLKAKKVLSKDEWAKIESIVRLRRERKEKDEAREETVYYITSLKSSAKIIADTARSHWDIENGLHWRLDIVFKQDKSRYRNRIGARNLAIARKIALNALMKENSIKRGVATKQCAAACNPAYREKLLKNLF